MNPTIAIVGSRDFSDENFVRQFVNKLDSSWTVVSGGADGVDSWAAEKARAQGINVVEIEPEWEDENGNYNPQAGFERNTEIIEKADWVVAFWDGESNGTKDSIDKALRRGKALNIYVRS